MVDDLPQDPTTAVADDTGLRPMTAADLPAAHALSAALPWPHRLADWEQAFAHAEGWVAERNGELIATGLRWLWGDHHATVGLIIVSASCRGRRIGHRLMSALLDGLDDRSVLLHATRDGLGLYRRLGFVPIGELRQHQGVALPAPLVALPPGWRLRPAGQNEAADLIALDAAARGMPRDALVAELLVDAEASVVVDQEGTARGFGVLRRFGRGHVIGPVVAPDADSAKAVIAHLVGLNAGRFTRIDVDPTHHLGEWLSALGLKEVDAPTTMLRGAPLRLAPEGGPHLYAMVTQALG